MKRGYWHFFRWFFRFSMEYDPGMDVFTALIGSHRFAKEMTRK